MARLGAELNRRVCERWMREGVTIVDPATTWIDADVSIGQERSICCPSRLALMAFFARLGAMEAATSAAVTPAG